MIGNILVELTDKWKTTIATHKQPKSRTYITHIQARTHACTHTHSCMHAHTCMCTHARTHARSPTHTHSLSLTHTHTLSLCLTRTHTHTHTHTHTRIHTAVNWNNLRTSWRGDGLLAVVIDLSQWVFSVVLNAVKLFKRSGGMLQTACRLTALPVTYHTEHVVLPWIYKSSCQRSEPWLSYLISVYQVNVSALRNAGMSLSRTLRCRQRVFCSMTGRFESCCALHWCT